MKMAFSKVLNNFLFELSKLSDLFIKKTIRPTTPLTRLNAENNYRQTEWVGKKDRTRCRELKTCRYKNSKEQ